MDRTLLAPLRLSHYKDSSVNPAGQRARITEYAEDNDDRVIFVDVDMDVSGADPIRERPGLGPWLAPDKIGQIDGFLADEMDRLSRDTLDYLQFARDMAALGKVIIDVSDGTDTSTERGRQQLEDRILAAQRERERMATRRRKAAKRLSDEGRWGGGAPGYGYSPRCICHGERRCPEPPDRQKGWWRVQDPEEAPIAKWMVQQRIAGRGFSAIAGELNERGIPAARGGKWNATSVSKILTSPLLLGHVVELKGEKGIKGMPGYKKGRIVGVRRGRDGQPVKFTDEPLIDQKTWDELQEAIRAGSRARGQAQSRHMLYRVLFCRSCSPKPFDPGTAVRMYGSRRHTAQRGVVRRESVQFTSQDQLSALGAFIMGQRKQARLSLAQLAELTTLSDSSLNKIERGLQRPSVRALRLISAAFSMPVEALLTEGAPGLEVVPERPYEQPHNAYYTCKSCGLSIRIDMIEPLIEALVIHEAGGRVLLEKRVVHGDDYAADIARLERAAERRRELLADDPGDEDMKASLVKTEAQIAALRSRHHEPDSFEWREVESGIKVADHWAALDTAGRAKFLRDWEVTCFADRQGAETRLGWLELYSGAFRLRSGDSRLCPTALPALITHSQEWQRVPGAVLPSRVAASPRTRL
ncbi:MAG TPA: recombinase family protein [Streptosporangiaceae bacterium]|nr:recombinase family protein [Streptosporangiaceae bacterium]